MASPGSSGSGSKTSVRVRSNSGNFNETHSSGNHLENRKQLEALPNHPLKEHLLARQNSWDTKYGSSSSSSAPHIHPPLGCGEVSAMIAIARSKDGPSGWRRAETATYSAAHEGSSTESAAIKTRCAHCETWQQPTSSSGTSNWIIKPEFHAVQNADKAASAQRQQSATQHLALQSHGMSFSSVASGNTEYKKAVQSIQAEKKEKDFPALASSPSNTRSNSNSSSHTSPHPASASSSTSGGASTGSSSVQKKGKTKWKKLDLK
jgi:hypothetical protein